MSTAESRFTLLALVSGFSYHVKLDIHYIVVLIRTIPLPIQLLCKARQRGPTPAFNLEQAPVFRPADTSGTIASSVYATL